MKFQIPFILASIAVSQAAIIARPRLFDILADIAQQQSSDPDANTQDLTPARLSDLPFMPLQEMMPSSDSNPLDDIMSALFGGASPASHMGPPIPSAIEAALAKTHIAENDTRVLISLELPGYSASELQVSIHGSSLTVTGDHKCEEGSMVWCEPQKFTEVFGLNSDRVVLKEAEVALNNGVLSITIPKHAKEVIDEKKVLQINANDIQQSSGKLTLQMV